MSLTSYRAAPPRDNRTADEAGVARKREQGLSSNAWCELEEHRCTFVQEVPAIAASLMSPYGCAAMIIPPDQPPTVLSALRLLGGWAGYQIEHAFVLALEGIQRLFNRLDPPVYSQAMRIRSVREGGDDKAGGKFFVLVLYCTDTLPAFTRTSIDAVARRPFNLV